MPWPENTNTMGGRVFGTITGLLKTGALAVPATAKDRHVIERARRPVSLARAAASVESFAVASKASPSAATDRGDSAAATRSTGTSAFVSQKGRTSLAGGGPCKTACPFAPPMPELVIAINGRPSPERHRSGSGSRGTRRRYWAHLIAGLGLL